MMEDFKEQWPKVDMDFMSEFVKLHNQVSFGKKTQEDFNKFVLDNKEKLNNPDYLQVFVENVEFFKENFLKENFEMCKFFYDFIENNPDLFKLDFGLRTCIRLGTFQDTFKKFIKDDLRKEMNK